MRLGRNIILCNGTFINYGKWGLNNVKMKASYVMRWNFSNQFWEDVPFSIKKSPPVPPTLHHDSA